MILILPHPEHAALLAPSPGGGTMPIRYLDYRFSDQEGLEWTEKPKRLPQVKQGCLCIGCGTWCPWGYPVSERHEHEEGCSEVARCANLPTALVISINGQPDPVGMARAREYLAGLDGRVTEFGVSFDRAEDGAWWLGCTRVLPAGVTDPCLALALILAHRGVGEVVEAPNGT